MKFGLAIAALSIGCLAQPGYLIFDLEILFSICSEIKVSAQITNIKDQEMYGLEIETESLEWTMLLWEMTIK